LGRTYAKEKLLRRTLATNTPARGSTCLAMA
jgi:hypothetical protein